LLDDWGAAWALFVFGLVAAADVGAFFAGRRFGRRKLAPTVSPGKTWEGVVGGLLLVGVVAGIGALLLGIGMRPAMLAAIACAAFSILGDLTVSMLKRSAGLKDSGQLFPGHGGVLDRIDSLLAALPLYLLLFGWITGR
jgi:phosphatidate cytidylyltransferase